MKNLQISDDKYAIRVVLIEDDETIRKGYQYLIDINNACKVVATYPSAEEAILNISRDRPDVVLLDIVLPGISGIDAISKIKLIAGSVEIIILTVLESEELIFDALSRGASGFLTKNTPPDKVIESIVDVMHGGGPLSIKIARMVIASFQKNNKSPLSKRETQILEQISIGKNQSRIAKELFIELETVKT